MEATAAGGGGSPAPFLLKTYDMVDDSATNDIVSWSSARNSFVVWNPPEFSRVLLPTYFKHNNFSSFIRQLNTYGFRKSDPERWEFANEDFVKDQKHLLKNIHRRKPIHSHSNPQVSAVDSERAALDDEIEKLSRDKEALQSNISHIKRQLTAKNQFEDALLRVTSIEKRQDNLQNFLEKAVQDPTFIDYLVQKIESMDFAAYNKKRRLPETDHSQPALGTNFVENNSISRPEFGNPFHQDFSNKLRLELSPAISDINLISTSTQSSNEDGETSPKKISEELRGPHIRTEDLFLASEALDLTDTGTSFGFKMVSSFPRKTLPNGNSFQPNISPSEEDDCRMSCQLNLSLASLPLQGNNGPYSPVIPQLDQDIGKSLESRIGANEREYRDKTLPSSKGEANYQETTTAPAKVNDVFWEQFLTERPGCSDNEEASSNFRANVYDEQNDGRLGQGISRSARNAERLTL